MTRLNSAIVAALQASETSARFMQLMAQPVHSTPDQFASLIQRELKRYERVVKASGVKAD